jgi:MazG family protein
MPYPEMERAIEVIKSLHHPETGCPWDLEQNHQTLVKYLIEETYEFLEAVELNDPIMMEEEIGDVLLQVLHHSTMGEKSGSFNIESVAKGMADKMIRRHPHVFGENANERLAPEEVIARWKELKTSENKSKIKYSIDKKVLYAPALDSAFKIGEKSTALNFDWEDYHQVIGKVEEEWQEVKEELPPGQNFNRERVQEEIGDLLFSVAQLARHLDLNPEECLKKANKKFLKRFQKMEDLLIADGKTFQETPQNELEKLWMKVKKL